MKRTLALILSALLILAAVPALAEDPEPIVGVWYMDAEPTDTISSRIVYLYFVNPDGGIYGMILMFEDGAPLAEATIGPRLFGSWDKGEDGKYRLFGWNGTEPSRVSATENYLTIPLPYGRNYCMFNRMSPFQSYQYISDDLSAIWLNN